MYKYSKNDVKTVFRAILRKLYNVKDNIFLKWEWYILFSSSTSNFCKNFNNGVRIQFGAILRKLQILKIQMLFIIWNNYKMVFQHDLK